MSLRLTIIAKRFGASSNPEIPPKKPFSYEIVASLSRIPNERLPLVLVQTTILVGLTETKRARLAISYDRRKKVL
jgi:hypothetical protein